MKTLVTGASRGIGYAIARALAAQGHELLMLAKSPDKLKKAATEIPLPALRFTIIFLSP